MPNLVKKQLSNFQHGDFKTIWLDLIQHNEVDIIQDFIESIEEEWRNEPITEEMKWGIFPIQEHFQLQNKFDLFIFYAAQHYAFYHSWGQKKLIGVTLVYNLPNDAENYLFHLHYDSPFIMTFQRLGLLAYAQHNQIEQFKSLFPTYYRKVYFEGSYDNYAELLSSFIKNEYHDIYRLCLNPQLIDEMFSSVTSIHRESFIQHLIKANQFFIKKEHLLSYELDIVKELWESPHYSIYDDIFNSMEYFIDIVMEDMDKTINYDDFERFDYLLNHSRFSQLLQHGLNHDIKGQFFKWTLESYGTTILTYLVCHESFEQYNHENLLLIHGIKNKQFATELIAKKKLNIHLQQDLSIQSTSSQHKI